MSCDVLLVYVSVALLASVAGEGYQVVADASDPKPLDHHEVVSFVVSEFDHLL